MEDDIFNEHQNADASAFPEKEEKQESNTSSPVTNENAKPKTLYGEK